MSLTSLEFAKKLLSLLKIVFLDDNAATNNNNDLNVPFRSALTKLFLDEVPVGVDSRISFLLFFVGLEKV